MKKQRTKKNQSEEKGFSLDEKVMIGDYVHDSTAAFIILAREPNNDNDNGEMLVTTRCNGVEQLISLIIEVMKKDENVEYLLKTAVMNYEIEKIKQRFSE